MSLTLFHYIKQLVMNKLFSLCFIFIFYNYHATAQIDAGLFRFPDVSKTQIVFTYANDIWIMPKRGGTAEKLSSLPVLKVFQNFLPMEKQLLSPAIMMATQMRIQFR